MISLQMKYALNIALSVFFTTNIYGASISRNGDETNAKEASLQRSGKSETGNQGLLEFSKGRLKLTARITVGETRKGKFCMFCKVDIVFTHSKDLNLFAANFIQLIVSGTGNQSLCFNDYIFDKYNDYEWNYQNLDKWEDELCKTGKIQSPVNLPRSGILSNIEETHNYFKFYDIISYNNNLCVKDIYFHLSFCQSKYGKPSFPSVRFIA